MWLPLTLFRQDFVLQDEMRLYRELGVLSTHIGAFSHDTPGRFVVIGFLSNFLCSPLARSLAAVLLPSGLKRPTLSSAKTPHPSGTFCDIIRHGMSESSSSPRFSHTIYSYFYCGPAAFGIPAKLEATIARACAQCGNVAPQQAAELIARMKKEGRWSLEAF